MLFADGEKNGKIPPKGFINVNTYTAFVSNGGVRQGACIDRI